MTFEMTDVGVKYDYSFGIGGARFYIYPLKGKHTEDDVKKAKQQLRREQDVISIQTEWKDWEQWQEMRLFLHVLSKENKILNQQYHQKYRKENLCSLQ